MFGFAIKKTFFDLWDNFLPAILANLGFILILAIPAALPGTVAPFGAAAGIVVLVLGVVLLFVYLGGVAGLARMITDYRSLEWGVFPRSTRDSIWTSLTLAAIVLAHLFLLSIAFPVYSSFDNVFGLFALAMLFWMSVLWWVSAPLVRPLQLRMGGSVAKNLKKAILFAFDNIGFVFALGIGALVIVALSVVTAFLVPGIAGLAIWFQTGVKLRLYKYDYLEEHPDADRREIPWDALLYDDRERVGKRTIRGMIFPWKE